MKTVAGRARDRACGKGTAESALEEQVADLGSLRQGQDTGLLFSVDDQGVFIIVDDMGLVIDLNGIGETQDQPEPVYFLRGDADGDGEYFALIDAIKTLKYLFVAGESEPPCLAAVDVDEVVTRCAVNAIQPS